MQAITQFYIRSNLQKRLAIGILAAVLLNAAYCLAYRYASGNPATLFEALSWGVINIAPWIAAVEIGRSATRASHLILLLLAAGTLSIGLEMAVRVELPTLFDLIRRVPGAVIAILTIGGLKLISSRRKTKTDVQNHVLKPRECDWVRSAGNYVEIHKNGNQQGLVRATLTSITDQSSPQLVRIHRRYAVLPKAIDRIEHNHIRLRDGTRLPVGDRYRKELSKFGIFAPSSQNH